MSKNFNTHCKVISHLDRVLELVTNADDLEREEVWKIRDRMAEIMAALEDK